MYLEENQGKQIGAHGSIVEAKISSFRSRERIELIEHRLLD